MIDDDLIPSPHSHVPGAFSASPPRGEVRAPQAAVCGAGWPAPLPLSALGSVAHTSLFSESKIQTYIFLTFIFKVKDKNII